MTTTIIECAILLAMASRAAYHFAKAIGKIVDEMAHGYGQGELPDHIVSMRRGDL